VNMDDTVEVGIAHASYSSQSDDGAVDEILVCRPVTVDFSDAEYSVDEEAGAATITVTLNIPSNQTITVDYATIVSGTATVGEDYTAASGTLTFDPNDKVETFTVDIIDDSVYEGDETVTLQLSNANGADIGPNDPATLTIIDDDLATVDFSSAVYSVGEGAGAATITVTLDTVSIYTITVDYATYNIEATAGEDYTQTAETLIFAPGEMTKTFEVQIIDDTAYEESEGVLLDLYNESSGASIGPNDPGTLTIIDDDGQPTVGFSSGTYSASEGAGAATITVTLSAASYQTVTVDYATTLSGTATEGDDYTANSGALTFAPGDTTATFDVPIIDDGEPYEGDETVSLALSDAVSATLGLDEATLTIVENDVVTVGFSSGAYSVNEDAGSATITVTLDSASPLTVTVEYTTSGGTATAGEDYAASGGALTFAPDETMQTFSVTIIDDAAFEGDETVELQLVNPVNANPGLDEATLTIVDSEPVATEEWRPFSVNFTDDITGGVESLIGQEIEVRFYATNDEDEYGTWFYLDALECEVCTAWPAPEPEAGQASVSGEVRVLVEGIPKTLQGVDVWAYSQGSEGFYHTTTIQDGTYYLNVEPGTYTIYSEIWVGGELRFATTTITVEADQQYTVNLFLL